VKAEEREEFEKIPKEYRPLTFGVQVINFLLFSIPVLGTLYWVCTAFFSKRVSLRSYARGLMLIYIFFLIVDVLILGGAFLIVALREKGVL
jgi:hypothetical protein